MRRPALLGVLAAAVLCADPASAQRPLRRAFEPAVTPFVAGTGFGDRVRSTTTVLAEYDYNNGVGLGIQAERPWTRRTALMTTLAVTPLTHVTRTYNGAVSDRARILVLGLDAGIAGRLKPSAAVFGYLGGGATVATSPPSEDLSGIHAEPRLSFGIGFDAMRRERTGFRLAYLGHYVFTRSPGTDYVTRGDTMDWTFILGGRYTFGEWGAEAP